MNQDRIVNLIKYKKDIIINEILKSAFINNEHKRYNILILDDETLKIINSSVTIKELNQYNIAMPVLISSKRDKIPTTAIYFIAPSSTSINSLISDFNDDQTYSAIYLFILGKLSNVYLSKIKKSPNLCLCLKALKELYINFDSISNHAAIFNYNTHLKNFYNTFNPRLIVDEITTIGNLLVEFIIGLEEFPLIRYYCNETCTYFASILQGLMEEKARLIKDLKSKEPRSTIIIIDRSFDPITPLVNDFSFESLLHNLLDTDFIEEQIKNCPEVFNEDNEDWIKYRYLHITDLILALEKEEKQLLQDKSTFQDIAHKQSNLNKLSKIHNQIPSFNQKIQKFLTYHKLASKCMKIIEERNLFLLSSFEQDMTTMIDFKGNELSENKIESRLSNLLGNNDIKIEDKLRLLLIYSKTQNIILEADQSEIFELAGLSYEEQIAVKNINDLNKNDENYFSKGKIKERSKKIPKSHFNHYDKTYNRYKPPMKDITINHLKNSLSREDFPYIINPPEEKKENIQSSKTEKRTIFIFIIGGLTYLEIKEAKQIAKEEDVNIFIVSTNTLVTHEYINNLECLNPSIFEEEFNYN